jgi:hypothetical protein
MSDLIERLRDDRYPGQEIMRSEAADRIEALEAALREAAKIAEDFDCHLCGYPNEEAEQYYSSGVMDASQFIAERIAALAPEQDK